MVFDPAEVKSQRVAMRYDLPGGAGRLYADSEGIDHVLVNGKPLVSDGKLTSNRPGRVLRRDQDTATSLN